MKNKEIILNISLTILLVLSLTGNLVLFNQFNTAKQAFADMQEQLEESKVKLQNAQLDWEIIQTNIASAQEENKQLMASVAVSCQVPSDPNKVLSSKLTLWEAKEMIETQIESLQESGYSYEDIKDTLESMAKDLGTTMSEINRCPDEHIVQQPSQQTEKPSTQQPSVQKPSQQTQQPSGESQLPVEIDKDRNGRVDAFEESEAGVGTTTSDPDFNLGTNP